MKRHGFHGLKASHGVERKHRSPGSIGACATPGRVFKGVRMAGRMGGVRFTAQGLTIQAVDTEKKPAPRSGADPGPQGRPGPGPYRGQVEEGEGWCLEVTTVDVQRRRRRQGRLRRAARRRLRRAGQHPADAPGRGRPARRRPPGHAQGEARGEVRGGGKKPYKQKGTGRARQGSTRAPQFTGGGVVHGPLPRNYAQRTPKKMKAAALRGALSDRAREGRLHVVERFVDGETP